VDTFTFEFSDYVNGALAHYLEKRRHVSPSRAVEAIIANHLKLTYPDEFTLLKDEYALSEWVDFEDE